MCTLQTDAVGALYAEVKDLQSRSRRARSGHDVVTKEVRVQVYILECIDALQVSPIVLAELCGHDVVTKEVQFAPCMILGLTQCHCPGGVVS